MLDESGGRNCCSAEVGVAHCVSNDAKRNNIANEYHSAAVCESKFERIRSKSEWNKMPGAPRFTQKPSIQQTPQGDLLMECCLEADPPPSIVWYHAGTPIHAGPRVEFILTNLQSNLYKAILIIKCCIESTNLFIYLSK
ncbi:unnamed protein product [Thelazia callipaeda]|uniref:Ig-like domain-containing protein n=1 Tax=Thelazia callipaeda TaxID=103827 RepID=A0A0N5D1Z3_THECL|nr:unnamed protein product [Thelazia callipaeda]